MPKEFVLNLCVRVCGIFYMESREYFYGIKSIHKESSKQVLFILIRMTRFKEDQGYYFTVGSISRFRFFHVP